MKKIISSVIAIAMLSSTVAMAATVVAPAPQTTKVVETQNFNDAQNNAETGKIDNGTAFGRTKVENDTQPFEAVANPLSGDENDKVIKLGREVASGDAKSMLVTDDASFFNGDIITISFDAYLKDVVNNATGIKLQAKYNGGNWANIMDILKGYIACTPAGGDMVYDCTLSTSAFQTAKITIDKVNQKITIVNGTSSKVFDISSNPINSIEAMRIRLVSVNGESNTEGADAKVYLDNLSYEVATLPDVPANEKLEEFNELVGGTGKTETLANSVVNIKHTAENVQNPLGTTRSNVLKTSGSSGAGSYIKMPLEYTMDNDDVFTFSFDYAYEPENASDLWFMINDDSNANNSGTSVHLVSADPSFEKNLTANSCLFKVGNGKIRVANDSGTEDKKIEANTFGTITVVIDNSDETCPDAQGNPQRTFAVYVNDELSKTKWIMTDAEGTNTRSISCITLWIGTNNQVRYFDNLWASLTENRMVNSGNEVSYTYPVVYDNATEAIFVKAYYDTNNRLISADASASATPNAGRTVKTNLNAPEGTVTTKVFRWDSLDAIHNLSPALTIY